MRLRHLDIYPRSPANHWRFEQLPHASGCKRLKLPRYYRLSMMLLVDLRKSLLLFSERPCSFDLMIRLDEEAGGRLDLVYPAYRQLLAYL